MPGSAVRHADLPGMRPHAPASASGSGDRVGRDRALFRRCRDPRDPVDRDAVVERFLPLARGIAARYQRPGEPFDDVFQVACFGLVKAVDRFDLDRGIAFSTFAIPTIAGEVKRHFRDRAWIVRPPRDLQELALSVERAVGDLTGELGRQPSVSDIARATGRELEDVLEAIQASTAYWAASFDQPIRDDDGVTTLGDRFGCVEGGFNRAEQRALLSQLMRSLTLRERNVVRLRFEHDLTQAEIGARLGISQMQVSRTLRRSMARLQEVAGARP